MYYGVYWARGRYYIEMTDDLYDGWACGVFPTLKKAGKCMAAMMENDRYLDNEVPF